MDFHTWRQRPSKEEIKEHVNRFFTALHNGSLKEAFTLCPVYTYKESNLIRNDDGEIERMTESMFEEIDGYGYLDEAKGSGPILASDTNSWLKFITPPAEVNYEQLNLDVPDGNSCEVLANVFINGEVTDISAIFDLREIKGAWILSLKMFKVM